MFYETNLAELLVYEQEQTYSSCKCVQLQHLFWRVIHVANVGF